MTLALGAHAFGSEPLLGDPLHDPPVATAVTLGNITSGGPTVTVSWGYQQAQGDPQEQYRVQLMDDAKAVTYYDSGWLFGTDTSHVIDFDAEEIPVETADITAIIQVRGPEAIGTGTLARYQAEDVDPFEIHWGNPHATILDPEDQGIVPATTGLDVAWSFSDDDGANTQGWYRVRVTLKDTGLVLFDTGWVQSSDTSLEVPVVLQDQWTYEVEVQLKNNHGVRSD